MSLPPPTGPLDLAITGYACRLPGAPDPEAFWSLLERRGTAISRAGQERWAERRFLHPVRGTPGRAYTMAAGLIDGVWDFDAAFFGISPREAEQMDPQQRLLLELAWEALEAACLAPGEPGNAMGRTGVYVGASAMDHAQRFASDVAAIDSPFMTGNSLSVLANRISYLLDLDGPSLTVDTACASGLTALHLAAGALARGEIDTAVVAGVNLLLQPFSFVGFSQAGMLSRQGLCRAFDAGADGYVRAEGGVGLVLRRVADAREGGEPVRSRLLGTGTASGGRSTGLTTPSQAAQAALITEVHARIGLAADALGFLEAHGTGTPVGDPIEAAAIGEALGRHRSTPLPIGSAKTNIGHLEPAAGLAGLLKAQLALEHGRYPASLHVETVNPAIDEDALNLRVARDAVALPERPGGAVWTAAVNAFGFGGANAHAVIEAVPWREVAGDGPLPPLLLTAASEKALAAMASDWRSRFLAEPSPALPDAASAAGHRRARLGRRAVLRAADAEALEAGLTALAAGRDAPGLVTGDAVEEGPVGFVFSGNGSQWAGMGADLRRTDPVFSDAYARVAALFRDSGGADLAELDRLEGEAAEDALRDSETGQAALLALQVGLVESLAAAGLTPGIVAGHSVGEVAAAWSAGALSLEDAVLLVVRRSRTVREIRGDGGMAAMLADADRAQSLIDGLALSDHLTLAADNSPRSVTISGEGAALDALAKGAKRARLPLRRLPVDYAYHSAVLESGRNGLIADLAELTPAEAAVPFVSATDAALRPGETLDGTYWYRNARERVRFREALLAMAEQGCRLFLEIGPRPVLASYARDTLANTPWRTVCLGSLEGPGRAPRDAGAIVAAALAHGARPDPERVFGPRRPVPARLPAYPWQRQRFQLPASPEAVDVFGREPGHPLLGARDRPGVGPWHNLIDTEVLPWLADHRVDSVPVLPATAYIEMALAVGRAELGPCPLELRDFDIVASLPLPDGQTMALRTSFDKETGLLRIESRPHCRDVAWTLHARGTLRDAAAESETLSDAAPDRTIDATDISSLYGGLSALGLDYGPTFRRVARLEATGSRSIAAKLRALEPAEDGEMHCHPAMLDAALHGLASLLPSHAPEEEPGSRRPFVPAHIGRLLYFPSEEAPSLQRAELTLVHASEVGAEVRLRLGDTSGAAQLVLDGLRLQPLHGQQRAVVPTLWDEALEPVRLPAEAVRLPTVWADPAARLGELGLASADGSMETTDDAAWLLLDELARIAAAEAVAVGIARHGPLPADGGERIAAQSRALFDALSRFLLADGALQLEDGRFNMAARSPYEPAAALVQALRCEAAEHASDLLALLDESETLAARLFDAGEPAARAPGIDAPRYRALWNRLATAALDMAKTWPDGERLAILVLGAPPPAFRSELTGCASIGEIVQADPRDQGGAFGEVIARARRFDIVLADRGALDTLDPTALAALAAALSPGAMLLTIGSDAGPFAHVTGEQGHDLRLKGRLGAAGFEPPAEVPTRLAGWPAHFLVARLGFAAELPQSLGILILHDPSVESAAQARALLMALAPSEGSIASLDAAAWPSPAGRLVVIVPPSEAAPAGQATLQNGEAGAGAALIRRIAACRRLVAGPTAAPPSRLVLLSHAQGDEWRPDDAALSGLARTLSNECEGVRVHHTALADDAPVDAVAEALTAVGDGSLDEPAMAVGSTGSVFASRLNIAETEAQRDALGPSADAGGRQDGTVSLQLTQPGALDSLAWRTVTRRAPEGDEVEIAVEATGLNFRDVMWAQRRLPAEAVMHGFAGASLGMECAGTVVRAGPEATYAPGDRVIAFAPQSFAGHVTVSSYAVARRPDALSSETAAALPVAFFTAQYALGALARLGEGETVLIHGATGGVGQAAMQIAALRGARVLATAGRPGKRRLAHLLGAEAVFDSRDGRFADAVMEATGGRGSDVVLNALAGNDLARSLECMAPFGRFVELGKQDLYANSRLAMRPLARNASFFAVDADQLLHARPGSTAEIMGTVLEDFAAGRLTAPALHIFEADEVAGAFRLMQCAGHVGKIVVRNPTSALARRRSPAQPQKATTGAWLITGGLGGFGLATAARLQARGATRLWLIGRTGRPARDDQAALAALKASGTPVETRAVDAADPASMEVLFQEIAARGEPLAGIVHAAMVLEDATLAEHTPDLVASVLRPKIGGAGLLDRLSRPLDPQHFVLFGSLAARLGNPGQAAYAAANASLEGLAKARRRKGLPGLTIAWGPIADRGRLASDGRLRAALEREMRDRFSCGLLRADQALDVFERLLDAPPDDPVVTVLPPGAAPLRSALPLCASPLFERVRRAGASSATDEEGALCERLQSLSVAEARALLLGTLRSEAARILRASPDDMKADVPLTALGFDSLMAVDLRLGLETRLGISLPLAGVSASTRLSDLAEDALARLRPAGAADCDTRASAPSGAASDESSAILKGLVSRHAPALDTEAASQLLEELAPAPRRSAR